MESLSNLELIRQVIRLYHSARRPKFANAKISRGRSHSVSSAVEDLFAYYLAEHIKCDHIYIDQPISVVSFKSRIYPDLVVVRGNHIVAFIDLKMDMGFNRRGLYGLCKKHYGKLDKAKGKKCKLKEGTSKKTHSYIVDKKATYNMVLVSDQNINSALLQNQIKKSSDLNPDVEVFVLTTGKHPNTYGITTKNLIRKIDINNDAFKKLIKKLEK